MVVVRGKLDGLFTNPNNVFSAGTRMVCAFVCANLDALVVCEIDGLDNMLDKELGLSAYVQAQEVG